MSTEIRPATRNDALHVAAIIDIAGHGIDLENWISDADQDCSVISSARHEALNEQNRAYHFSKAHLLEVDGIVAGGIIGDIVHEARPPVDIKDNHLKPLIILESRVAGYWSIVAIALYPEFRGNGLATLLLEYAVGLARITEARGLSLVVEDTNNIAVRFYKAKGFVEVERLPWIPYGNRQGPTDWVMLTRDMRSEK